LTQCSDDLAPTIDFSTLRAYGFGRRLARTSSELSLSMFKISIVDSPAQRKVVIDLTSVTVISREGENAILDLMKRGAKFTCAGILTRHVLKGLARKYRCAP
jgi:hypothetical protein